MQLRWEITAVEEVAPCLQNFSTLTSIRVTSKKCLLFKENLNLVLKILIS